MNVATEDRVEREALEEFVRPRRKLLLVTTRDDGPPGVERLVDYYCAAAGEHDDWDEYRQAMRERGKVAIDVTITDWGPIATGGVPPEFAGDA